MESLFLSVLADLRSSRRLCLRATERTAEPESTGLIRSMRFSTTELGSYRATWKMQFSWVAGKTGLVKWYSHLPEASAAGEGLRRRKCPWVIKQWRNFMHDCFNVTSEYCHFCKSLKECFNIRTNLRLGIRYTKDKIKIKVKADAPIDSTEFWVSPNIPYWLF